MPTEPVRLKWRGAEALDDETRARLIGPGAPFELVEEDGDAWGVPSVERSRERRE